MNFLQSVVNPFTKFSSTFASASMFKQANFEKQNSTWYTIEGGQVRKSTHYEVLTARGKPIHETPSIFAGNIHSQCRESLRSLPEGEHTMYQKLISAHRETRDTWQAAERQMDANLRRNVCIRHNEERPAKGSEWRLRRYCPLRKLKRLANVRGLLQNWHSPVRKCILISIGEPFQQVRHSQAHRNIKRGKLDIRGSV